LFIKFKRNGNSKTQNEECSSDENNKQNETTKKVELTDENGNVVRDIFGNIIYCQGGWIDPGNAHQFISAIGTIHKARNQKGTYIHPCDTCLSEQQKNNFHGCRIHPFNPQYWRKGDPTCDELVVCALKQSSNEGK
jgi:hypothetical protein